MATPIRYNVYDYTTKEPLVTGISCNELAIYFDHLKFGTSPYYRNRVFLPLLGSMWQDRLVCIVRQGDSLDSVEKPSQRLMTRYLSRLTYCKHDKRRI